MKFALEIVDELYREGLEMKRQQLRRSHPGASARDIEALVKAWVADRPLDAPGRVRTS